MNNIAKVLSVILVGSALLYAQPTAAPTPGAGGATQAPNETVNPLAQSRLIRILTPVAGQASASNAILVRYELTNPGADAGEPNFKLQLDGMDPVTTTATEYNFTGLAPGGHSITIVLVDANGTPIRGGSAVVQFSVKNPAPAPRGSSALENAPTVDGDGKQGQPAVASNSLPILSLIGFGVLIGGVASALKTRG